MSQQSFPALEQASSLNLGATLPRSYFTEEYNVQYDSLLSALEGEPEMRAILELLDGQAPTDTEHFEVENSAPVQWLGYHDIIPQQQIASQSWEVLDSSGNPTGVNSPPFMESLTSNNTLLYAQPLFDPTDETQHLSALVPDWSDGLDITRHMTDERILHQIEDSNISARITTGYPTPTLLQRRQQRKAAEITTCTLAIPTTSGTLETASVTSIPSVSLTTPSENKSSPELGLPEIPEGKWWIRTNGTTKPCKRAKRINDQANIHYAGASPCQTWHSTHGYLFRYTEHGELDKKEKGYSAKRLLAYIHEKGIQGGLKLRIQRAPADSARRYASATMNMCKFSECPLKLIGCKRNIAVGHYRVAFDEKWNCRKNINPFDCAGYVHLYCLERFLDFERICKQSLIEFDIRPEIVGRARVFEHVYVNNFIERARIGTLRSADSRFKRYPISKNVQDKVGQYKHTLCYRLVKAKVESKINKIQRDATTYIPNASQEHVNLGDLQMSIDYELQKKQLDKRKRGNDEETSHFNIEDASPKSYKRRKS